MIADSKLSLAKIYSQLDDIKSTSNAENLLSECIKFYEDLNDEPKIFKVLDEMIKLNLKQERYDVSKLFFQNIKLCEPNSKNIEILKIFDSVRFTRKVIEFHCKTIVNKF